MSSNLLVIIRACCCALPLLALGGAEFAGWQRLQVIDSGGGIGYPVVGDVDGDGRAEVILANRRQSRIDIYGHRRLGAGGGGVSQELNALPLPPGVIRSSIPLDRLPAGIALVGGAKATVLVLVERPLRLQAWRFRADAWHQVAERRLLAANPQQRLPLLHDGEHCLIACSQGIQVVPMALGDEPTIARATWLAGAGQANRLSWQRADVDGDGRADLVERASDNGRELRWYRRGKNGYAPPRLLDDDSLASMAALNGTGTALIATIASAQKELVRLRRYRAVAESDPFGRRDELPLGGDAAWCGFRIAGDPAVVVVRPDDNVLRCFRLGADGWQPLPEFPAPRGLVAVRPSGSGDALYFLSKDGALLRASWEEGRIGFPLATELAAGGRALGLGGDHRQTWWTIQDPQAGQLRVLRQGMAGQDAVAPQTFAWKEGTVEDALPIGLDRLLIKREYKRHPYLLSRDAKGVITLSDEKRLPVLKGASLKEFRFVAIGGEPTLVRITDGLAQVLDRDLAVVDQIQLPQGQQLEDLIDLGEQGLHALQLGGTVLSRLEADQGAVLRPRSDHRLPGGSRIVRDPVLGPVLVAEDRLVRLAAGQPRRLESAGDLAARDVHARSEQDPVVSRVLAVHLDGRDLLVISDDVDHRLTLVAPPADSADSTDSAEGSGGKSTVLASWRVFDNRSYPYGGGPGMARSSGEPRAITAGDCDGDGRDDLVLLCHDRCLLYLSGPQQSKQPTQPEEAP